MGKDLTGQRFGHFTALYPIDKRDNSGYVVWVMRCDCGNIEERSLHNVGSCYKKNHMCHECQAKNLLKATTKHGDSHARLYSVHSTMMQRCNNPNAHAYKNYGGRGIKVCEEWHDYEAFKEWALANGYEELKQGKCTLDRIDPNKGYSPDNCRWVDMKTQQRNRRNNVRLTLDGETKTLTEWAELTGTKPVTMRKRLEYGWPVREVILGR